MSDPREEAMAALMLTPASERRKAASQLVIAWLEHKHADGCKAPSQEHPKCKWCKRMEEAAGRYLFYSNA